MLRSSSPGEYSYDYMRSASPLHSAMAHLHHNHHCHSSRAAAAADISRLLDPSYLPASSSRAAYISPTTVTAYVDPHGDLHDPDYRHFPVSHHTPQVSKNTRRVGASPRPHFDWEVDLDENALDDEYADDFGGHMSRYNTNSPTATSASRSYSSQYTTSIKTRPRESSFSTTSYYSPTTTASTLPTSYEDDVVLDEESPFEDEKKEKKGRRLSKSDKEKEKKEKIKAQEKERLDREREEREHEAVRVYDLKEKEEEESRLRSSLHTPRRSLSNSRPRRRTIDDLYDDEYPHHEEDDSAYLQPTEDTPHVADTDYVPSCSQSLRRQWQALTLGFRFSVFRAQRRMSRRVASLL